MGLKVRRLKNGFAYYGEYKFADGDGGQHCIYEQVEANSLREARRMYAARRKALEKQLPKRSTVLKARSGSAGDRSRQDDGERVIAALLKDLQTRDYISNLDLLDALASAYTEVHGMADGTAVHRAREFLRSALDGSGDRLVVSTDDSGSIVPFGKTRGGARIEVGAELVGEVGNIRPYRVRLLPG